MAGIKIPELVSTQNIFETDVLALARNGETYKIYGRVFCTSSQVLSSQSDFTDLESVVSNLENQKLSKSDDTMLGNLALSGNPTAKRHAAPKQYVDQKINNSKTWASRKC